LRTSRRIEVDAEKIRWKLPAWGNRFRECVWLDSNDHHQHYSSFDAILAVDAFTSIVTDTQGAFDRLQEYYTQTRDWLFGYLSYDLKNDLEDLKSENHDGLGFHDLFFFQPRKLFCLRGNELELSYLKSCDDEMDDDLIEIFGIKHVPKLEKVTVKPRLESADYLERVSAMKQHILRGDIYEANFCMEYFADAAIDPLSVYQKLNSISTPPFACYLKNYKHYLMSASPERYLRKQGDKIISQPIKGTARRSPDPETDRSIMNELSSSQKERAENIMITDLVRNDLSRTATKGSVLVEELCGVYTFRQVHHLISTIVSGVPAETNPVDVLRTTFPMGSMTGAPKISALSIIEKLEATKRGLYSGAVGYFTPDSDFDFNVVIRSILYNADKNYVSFSVGSAITAASDAEKEYDECLLKARAMRNVLECND
jgi:para-aminobenzoate synthetase component 1